MTDRPFVCPFCPLHCDDLSIEALEGRCELFADRFAAVQRTDVDSENDEGLLATAGQWLAQAKTIVVTGTIVDLDTARAVCDFVAKTGASLNVGCKSIDGYSEAFARDGMFSITLGDAASPHQNVVMIGDCSKRLPRLKERLSGARSVYSWRSTENLVDRLAQLRLMLKRPEATRRPDDPDISYTMDLCQNESAIVFAIHVGGLVDGQQRPFWSTVQGILSELNRRIRASVLRFDDSMTMRSVLAWLSDGPQPSATVIEESSDLEIRFSPWPIAVEAAADRSGQAPRRITIGWQQHQSASSEWMGNDSPESIHLQSATPGTSMDGIVIRGDGSVTLPLRRLWDANQPTVSMTLSRLMASMDGLKR